MINKSVLHISSFDSQGAGGAAYKIHQSLIEKGYSSSMLVMNKSKSDQSIIQVPINKIRRFFFRIIEKVQNYLNIFDSNYFFFNRGVYLVDDLRQITSCVKKKPDIIFVYWISKFISISMVNELALLYGAKVYWWVLDKEPMTGGCHYVNDCRGYLTECASCPAVPRIFNKVPMLTYRAKKELLLNCDIKLVYTTPWMKQMLTESLLLRDLDHVYMPSYFNEDIFNIRKNVLDRNEYGISQDDFVVIFGAVNVEEKRKGYKYLINSLLDYQERFGTQKVVLLTMGMGHLSLGLAGVKIKHIHLGPLNLEVERALVYNIGDILISPSTEDMGPALLVEAMLCGLPAISFDIGVAKDIIKDGVNGYIAEFENHIDISSKLYRHQKLSKEHCQEIRLRARSEVVSVFLKASYDEKIKEILS